MYNQPMDTHAIVGTLTKNYKLPVKQAEAIVYAVQQGQNVSIQGLSSKEYAANLKEYLADFKLTVSKDIARIDAKLNLLLWITPIAVSAAVIAMKFL